MKKANSILLTDFHLEISLDGCEMGTVNQWESTNNLVISGKAIANVLEAAGISLAPLPAISERQKHPYSLRDTELKIGHEITNYPPLSDEAGETYKIFDLEAEVVAANLINIKIYSRTEKQTHIEEMTYSGNFLIEWRSE